LAQSDGPVLVLGAGGREHAIIQALSRSPRRPELLCAPGNAGIERDARLLELDIGDPRAVAGAARAQGVSLVVVGPEAPLVAGVADALAEEGIPCFGPRAAAAAIEGSKAFCKEVMAAAGVPTAAHRVVTEPREGMAAIDRYPVVIKADGLAAGKGVVVAHDQNEARRALEELLVEHRFGTEQALVEEHLVGEEVSLLAVCDGRHALPLASARDYKRIFDGDEGPNTGGMGAYSPVAAIDTDRAQELTRIIHQPVLDELRRRGAPFHGCLYAGLMMTADGPRVLEFNARFGDPETQAILPRLRADLLELMARALEPGGLEGVRLQWSPQVAVTVVLASRGYPESSSSGETILGLDQVPADIHVTHAGTARAADGRLVTAGGRVLSVTALGDDADSARARAYAAAEMIEFEGRQLRRDVALGATAPPTPASATPRPSVARSPVTASPGARLDGERGPA
jgi:phosphoribosylamine--glycine ligase